MAKGQEQTDKNRKWPYGTETGEIISLPKLPPEWETVTDDPEINRIANLAHLALATTLYSRINSLSFMQSHQLGKLFERECLKEKAFFAQSAHRMEGNISSDRLDFVKTGTTWVDDTERWLHANWRDPIDMDAWNDLVRRLYSLMDIHNVLWAISIEHFKSVEVSIKAKLFQILKKFHTKENQEVSPSKWQRIWTCVKRIPRWIYYLVGFLAALLTCIYLSWWLWTKFSG